MKRLLALMMTLSGWVVGCGGADDAAEVGGGGAGPIDDTDHDPSNGEDGPEGDINAWPLGEALIDDVVTGPDFGEAEVGVTSHKTGVVDPILTHTIINSTDIAIDAALIACTSGAGNLVEDEICARRQAYLGAGALSFEHVLRLSVPDGAGGVAPSPTYGDQLQSQSAALGHQLRRAVAEGEAPPPEGYVYVRWEARPFTYPRRARGGAARPRDRDPRVGLRPAPPRGDDEPAQPAAPPRRGAAGADPAGGHRREGGSRGRRWDLRARQRRVGSRARRPSAGAARAQGQPAKHPGPGGRGAARGHGLHDMGEGLADGRPDWA